VTRVRPRIVHFHDPELIVVCVLLKLLGFRVIYDVHENLPLQILYKDWIPRFLRAPMASCATVLERLGAARFDGVVAATPSISSRFPSSKTTVVQNFPRPEELWCVDGGAIRDREPLAAYVGGITEIRGAREMIEALARVPSKYRLKLCMAGAFSTEELRHELMRSAGRSKVEEQGWIARDAVARLMSRARMGLLVFHPVPNHLESQPNKLFEYMSAGLPVIASDFPLWRDIAGSCAIFVDPLDPQAIADAIVWLLDHPDESERLGRKGRVLVETKYNWAREGEKLVRFYRELMR
jgi:glycosyltransferase involved in cell wall biosynthesis